MNCSVVDNPETLGALGRDHLGNEGRKNTVQMKWAGIGADQHFDFREKRKNNE